MLALHFLIETRVQRTQAAWDFAKENDTSIREAECQIDIGLFLDEYPQWGLGTPHLGGGVQSIILHVMFLHAAERGWKEAECMVLFNKVLGAMPTRGSVYDSDSEVDQSAMELVGYHMSQKEIRDIYQSIYLLWRMPQVSPLAEPNQGERPSRIYFLL